MYIDFACKLDKHVMMEVGLLKIFIDLYNENMLDFINPYSSMGNATYKCRKYVTTKPEKPKKTHPIRPQTQTFQ